MMRDPNLANTQPVHPKGGQTRPVRVNRKKRKTNWWGWLLLGVILFALLATAGGLLGYWNGVQAKQQEESVQNDRTIQEQYDLGVQDLEAGRYEVAKQRFEYVLSLQPGFPGVADHLAQAMQVLYATATPTPLPPTVTPTPTRDLRPIEDLFAQAQAAISRADWSAALDTMVELRKVDRLFRVTEVDRMMYLALRNRGVLKILQESNLEGGSYDLALAERFGPLDVEANTARDWARLYMYGVSFWEAIPERAVYYFSQVAAAAPYLRDGSGWTARERYREVLIQYGDLFAAQEDWCNAQVQYELAGAIRLDDSLQGKIVDSAQNCAPPTEIPTETQVETATPTLTPTLEIILPTATATLEPQPPATETPPPPLEPSPTSGEVTPSETAPLPSETPAPPSETPSPPMETPAPPTEETPGSDVQATLPTEVIIPEP